MTFGSGFRRKNYLSLRLCMKIFSFLCCYLQSHVRQSGDSIPIKIVRTLYRRQVLIPHHAELPARHPRRVRQTLPALRTHQVPDLGDPPRRRASSDICDLPSIALPEPTLALPSEARYQSPDPRVAPLQSDPVHFRSIGRSDSRRVLTGPAFVPAAQCPEPPVVPTP
jgi:hypothetical protein